MFEAFKKTIPLALKYPFWYLFKAPQRQFGLSSIYRDFKGIFWFLIGSKFPVKLKPISICLALKNRNKELENIVLKSLESIENPNLLELSIFDCGTEDKEELERLCQSNKTIQIKLHVENRNFERTYAINKAVENAKHPLIFVTDVDFGIPSNIVSLVNQYTRRNYMWFPIVFYLYKDKEAIIKKGNGEWMIWGGKGLFACQKSSFYMLGKLNENFKNWGSEDEEFWLRCHEKKQCIIRNKAPYLLHHWHPSFNDKYNKLVQAH
jgi:glycosyltransferase involved in cell wall biosynthesis